jgi:PhnB protein
MFTHAGTPAAAQVPPEWQNKIMHVSLKVGDDVLMGSDAPPERFKGSHGYSVNIAVEQPAEAERVFHALSANGKVHMPIGQTFWAERFGMLVDQFGIPWMVNCQGSVKL